MRKVLLFIFLLLSSVGMMAQGRVKVSMGVYTCDRKDSTVNVRRAPNGDVVARLNNLSQVRIDMIQGKWCRMRNDYVDDAGEYRKVSKTGGRFWVHISCLACDFIGDGGVEIDLYEEASRKSKRTVITTDEETRPQEILDMRGGWIRLKLVNGVVAWVPEEYICGNPLTVCN